MTLRGLLDHYGERVRAHPVQELLAGVGVAIGVALVFAVLVANSSIAGNARELVHGIAGSARLELSARSADGFDAALLKQVRALSDVRVASPLLEQRAAVIGPGGRSSIDLVGVDGSITRLGGFATRQLDPAMLVVLRDGLILPSSIAKTIGVPMSGGGDERHVMLALRGRKKRIGISAVLGAAVVGPVADAAVAIAPLDRVQALSGLPGRISRILVTPKPGRDAAVRDELRRIARGRITVAPVDREVQLIAQAAAPSYQATGLFAAIAAVCGALLVFNAMLLTAPERRRSIAVLRVAAGYRAQDVARMLMFDAAVLGVLASGVGLALGMLLARTVFAGAPSFLSFAFALSGDVAIPPLTAVLAGAGGVLVTCLAATPLLLDLRSGRPLDAVEREQGEAGQRLPTRSRTAMAVAALAVLTVTTVYVAREPDATIVGIGVLAVATALTIPLLCLLAARCAARVAERMSWHALDLAAEGLRARTVRASTLAAMGAVAVCGCLAIEGAHRDVLRGLDSNFTEFLASGDVWVTAGGAENSLTTESFPAGAAARRVRAVGGVARVRPYYGGLLDVGERRVWVIARGARDATPIPPSQLLHGDLARAGARVRAGGWVAVSNTLASIQHTGVGGAFRLPTPAGMRTYRVAAITTNLGWGPGAVIMSAARYRHDWLDPDPSALEVDLASGANALAARHSIQRALGSGSDLQAQTSAERDTQFRALARQGLGRLSQISAMLIVAAALSLAAGMIAAIWQRRLSLAVLRIAGHRQSDLWRIVLIEATIVLGTGCLAGVAAGTLGHRLLTRWLGLTTGYPAQFALGATQVLVVVAGVLVAALVLIALAGIRAARVDPRIAFHG